jgi:hypothetical protein
MLQHNDDNDDESQRAGRWRPTLPPPGVAQGPIENDLEELLVMAKSRLLAYASVLSMAALVLAVAGCGDYDAGPAAPQNPPAATNAQSADSSALPAPGNTPAGGHDKEAIRSLKQIGLAIHNFAQANRHLPPAYISDDNGKPLLSWRVYILAYLEEDKLLKEFHMNESWDSPHNKKLIAKMPAAYRDLDGKAWEKGKTNFLTVRGENTVFPGKDGITFGDISDGTDRTIMLVEVNDERAVEWTRPDDFEYDQENPFKGLGGLRPTGFLVGMADCSVRALKATNEPNDAAVLKALFIRNDGQPAKRGN